jgi:hypothetical protein
MFHINNRSIGFLENPSTRWTIVAQCLELDAVNLHQTFGIVTAIQPCAIANEIDKSVTRTCMSQISGYCRRDVAYHFDHETKCLPHDGCGHRLLCDGWFRPRNRIRR